MKVLEISPHEPPASGWTMRVKLLRRVIHEGGGKCEILDIGPSRKLKRADCVSVLHGWDYFLKVLNFVRRGFIVHSHINAEYFRGLLLALAACFITRLFGNRCVVTFHGGSEQRFLKGWRRHAIGPLFWVIFSLAHVVICNSKAEKEALRAFQKAEKIVPIPAFSKQYLEYEKVRLDPALEQFINNHSPLATTYVCFRDGFYVNVILRALGQLVKTWPKTGIVMVGTGDGVDETRQHISAAQLDSNIYIAGDLAHDTFLTLLAASDLHLRSHMADGVSATVLEALALGIPVVASENGTRPSTVITYNAPDPHDLVQKLNWTLENHAEVVASLEFLEIMDTAQTEVDVIFGGGGTASGSYAAGKWDGN